VKMSRRTGLSRINQLKDLLMCTVFGVVRDWQRYKRSGTDENRALLENSLENLEEHYGILWEKCMDYGKGIYDEVVWRRSQERAEPGKPKKAN